MFNLMALIIFHRRFIFWWLVISGQSHRQSAMGTMREHETCIAEYPTKRESRSWTCMGETVVSIEYYILRKYDRWWRFRKEFHSLAVSERRSYNRNLSAVCSHSWLVFLEHIEKPQVLEATLRNCGPTGRYVCGDQESVQSPSGSRRDNKTLWNMIFAMYTECPTVPNILRFGIQ